MPLSRRHVLAGAAGLPLAAGLTGRAVAAPEPLAAQDEPAQLLVGRGIADVTGPAAENGMMGYSMPDQQTAGIHLRTRARAYVLADPAAGTRIAYVVADLGMIFQAVHQAVLARLAQRYGDTYTAQNVLLTATHSHAACGGDSHYALYNLSILGFQRQTHDAVVTGIVDAIAAAHDDLKPGSVTLGRTELADASANRSRAAFDLNPEEDRAHFPLGIDPAMTVLRLKQNGADAGAICWFATHGTSMTNKNRLISGDNKGYAAYEWEHDHAGVRYLDGPPRFVAAFPQTNAGDMSPNLNLSPGSGPTEDEFENTRIIGDRQFRAAKRAFDAAAEPVTGGLGYRLRYLDMSTVDVAGRFTPDGTPRSTTTAGIGVSLLAGSTEDGPGIPIGEGIKNPFLDAIGGWDHPVPGWLADAQAPKPVVVPTGALKPYPWTPEVLPLQIVRIGQLCLVAGPAEYTIVAGLRIRRAVAQELGLPLGNVLMQGYANAYSQYVTTPQEYDSQQYEGASTLFGRYTLPAYQQEFARLAAELRDGAPVDQGPDPRDLTGKQLNFQPGVLFDDKPLGRDFGDVLTEPAGACRRGDRVVAEFVTGHPKNNLRIGETFLEVQRLVDGAWVRHADDGDWATKYRWQRTFAATSKAVLTWEIPANTPIGRYRIVHRGDWKNGWNGRISALVGVSRPFLVS